MRRLHDPVASAALMHRRLVTLAQQRASSAWLASRSHGIQPATKEAAIFTRTQNFACSTLQWQASLYRWALHTQIQSSSRHESDELDRPRHLVGDEHWALPSAWLASFSANKHARPTVCRDAVPPLSHRQVASSAERRSATFETEDRLDRPTATMCHATSVPWLNMQKRGSTVTLGLTVKRLALKPSQEACTVAIEQSAANEHTKPLELCCRRDCRATPSDPCLRTSMHRRSSLRRRGPQFGFRACGLDSAQPAAACWVQGHMSGRRFGEPNRPLGWWGAVCKGRHTRGQASVPMLSRATLGGSARSNLSPRCFFQKKAQFL